MRLRDRLAEIREAGFAVSRGELDPDVLGVAAPVRNEDGRVVAAISIAALSHRVSDADIEPYVTAVHDAAATLTAQFSRVGDL